jgi:hypothetical protein
LDKLKEEEGLIYILDSIDSLVPKKSVERLESSLKKDKEEEASYGMEKAKYFSSSFFDRLCSKVREKDATIFLISQLREKIGVTFGEKKKRVGGKALDFYTHQVPWLYEKAKLRKTVKGEERVYGIQVRALVKRNKTAKPYRETEFTILFDYGIDNIGSMVDFLYGVKDNDKKKKIIWGGERWVKEKKEKEIREGAKAFYRDALIKYIEENNLIEELIDKVEEKWYEIEEGFKPQRKKKYGGNYG